MLRHADGFPVTVNAAPPTGKPVFESTSLALQEQRSQQPVLSLFREESEAKVLFDASGTVAFASGATLLLLGSDAAQLGGTRATQLPRSVGQPLDGIAHQAFVTRTVVEQELAVTRPDGRTLALRLRAKPMVENDAVLGVGVIIKDSGSRRVLSCSVAGDLAGALEASRYSPFSVVFLDDGGNYFDSNDLWPVDTGLTAVGSLDQGWLTAFSPRDLETFRHVALAAHQDQNGWRTELAAANGAGRFAFAAAPVFDDRSTLAGYVGFLTPIASTQGVGAARHVNAPSTISTAPAPALPSSSVASLPAGPAERQTSAVSSEPGTDRVTGLPNRLLFTRHVATTLERMKTDGLTIAMSLIDLEGVREQRARSGTRVAEDSLFLLAKRLESTIRNIEIAGAVGPDRFGVLSINWLFAEDLPIVTRRLLARLEEPLAGRDGEFVVNMHLGMSVARVDDTFETLLARAEESLLVAATSPERYFIEGLEPAT